MKLWGGRFEKETDPLVHKFMASLSFDQRLWKVDILGSLAHVAALGKASLLTADEVQIIHAGLHKISEDLETGKVPLNAQNEDIHSNIENLLFAEIGEFAGKMHTGRSRNDQVALDLHLYLREQLLNTVNRIHQLQTTLLQQAIQHIDTILPGYTHLQHAQPIRLAHHFLAYIFMLQRDVDRLISSWPRVNHMPLGAGALAGSGFPIDRDFVANILHFDGLYENSVDAVSDRDFVAEFQFQAALVMMHLSRFCEELILWSSQEFSFIELDDAYCTGSSMMPQKKNPDVAELVRGKTGRVYGALMGILTVLKSLPLAYNKDLQEDKEGLFDTLDTVNHALTVFTGMIATMKINTETMFNAVQDDFSTATALADYLVKKGVIFREAHKIIGNLVIDCIHHTTSMTSLSLEQLQGYSPHFTEDVVEFIHPEKTVELCSVKGGTAKGSVLEQIEKAKGFLDNTLHWYTEIKQKILAEDLSSSQVISSYTK